MNEKTLEKPIPGGISANTTAAATADDLKHLLQRLPDEERRKAQLELGTTLPRLQPGVDKEPVVFGYHCRQCNNLGLEFVGEMWEVPVADGWQVWQVPPVTLPWQEIRWVQNRPDRTYDRQPGDVAHPKCQYCHNALKKGPKGGPHPDYIVKVAEWESLRAEAARRKDQKRWIYANDQAVIAVRNSKGELVKVGEKRGPR